MHMDHDGAIRVGGTRVTLDTVIGAFNHGCSPEEILLKYPPLELVDIYSVITYYLWHRTELDAYLQGRHEQAERIRSENESRFSPQGLRERLLARRTTES